MFSSQSAYVLEPLQVRICEEIQKAVREAKTAKAISDKAMTLDGAHVGAGFQQMNCKCVSPMPRSA
jgi:hypothetical protein